MQPQVSWLDLCCGTGRALLDAAQLFRGEGALGRIMLVGVDLVSMFYLVPPDIDCLRLEAAPVSIWRPNQKFDLVTCVHGLHYIGDKLNMIQKAASWLNQGRFLAHLEYNNLHLRGGSPGTHIGKHLGKAGFKYNASRHLLSCKGPCHFSLAYRYLGADDTAGPNYTGQAAVNSFYERPPQKKKL